MAESLVSLLSPRRRNTESRELAWAVGGLSTATNLGVLMPSTSRITIRQTLIALATIATLVGCSRTTVDPAHYPELEAYAPGQVGVEREVSVRFPGDASTSLIEVEEFDGVLVYQSDIIVSDPAAIDGSLTPAGAGVQIGGRWPLGVVPYMIHNRLGETPSYDGTLFKDLIASAISHWEELTNGAIRFVRRTPANAADYPNFVFFIPGDGCAAHIGMRGGEQHVYLSSGCEFGAVVHEIGHVVGLFHEQSRHDRGTHVDIKFGNVKPKPSNNKLLPLNPLGYHHNFRTSSQAQLLGEYDLGSIMHYQPWAFAKDADACIGGNLSKCTIVPKDTSVSLNQIGQRDGLSAGDLESVASLYPPFILASTLTPADLYTIDLSPTGHDRRLGRLTHNGLSLVITDLATCPDGTYYAISFDALYTLNPITQRTTLVGAFGVSSSMNSLACDPAGTLYAGAARDTNPDFLFTLDKETGRATPVGPTGHNGFVGDIAFDATGRLFATIFDADSDRESLALIDLDSGAATVLHTLSMGGIFGLSFENGTLYGVTTSSFYSSGQLISIDVKTGDVSHVRNLSFNASGATSNSASID